MVMEQVLGITSTGVKTKSGNKVAIGNASFQVGEWVCVSDGVVVKHSSSGNHYTYIPNAKGNIIVAEYQNGTQYLSLYDMKKNKCQKRIKLWEGEHFIYSFASKGKNFGFAVKVPSGEFYKDKVYYGDAMIAESPLEEMQINGQEYRVDYFGGTFGSSFFALKPKIDNINVYVRDTIMYNSSQNRLPLYANVTTKYSIMYKDSESKAFPIESINNELKAYYMPEFGFSSEKAEELQCFARVDSFKIHFVSREGYPDDVVIEAKTHCIVWKRTGLQDEYHTYVTNGAYWHTCFHYRYDTYQMDLILYYSVDENKILAAYEKRRTYFEAQCERDRRYYRMFDGWSWWYDYRDETWTRDIKVPEHEVGSGKAIINERIMLRSKEDDTFVEGYLLEDKTMPEFGRPVLHDPIINIDGVELDSWHGTFRFGAPKTVCKTRMLGNIKLAGNTKASSQQNNYEVSSKDIFSYIANQIKEMKGVGE